jgi:hypothetical protein
MQVLIQPASHFPCKALHFQADLHIAYVRPILPTDEIPEYREVAPV